MQDLDIICPVSQIPTGQVWIIFYGMGVSILLTSGKMDPLAAMYGYHHQPLADHRLGELDPRDQVLQDSYFRWSRQDKRLREYMCQFCRATREQDGTRGLRQRSALSSLLKPLWRTRPPLRTALTSRASSRKPPRTLNRKVSTWKASTRRSVRASMLRATLRKFQHKARCSRTWRVASSRSPGWKTFEIKKLEFLLIRFEIVFLLQHPQLQLRQAKYDWGEAAIEKKRKTAEQNLAAFLVNSLQQVWKLATAGRTKDLQIWKSPAILATYWQLLECENVPIRQLLREGCSLKAAHSFCSCLLSCSFELQLLPFEFMFEVMLLYART